MEKVVIIGAGPAGLFASYLLLAKGYSVDLYDQKKEPGRKLLLAGRSGLNITNTIEPDLFIEAYGDHKKEIFPALSKFSPKNLRTWLSSIGIKTFTGSSGQVFPSNKNTAELLSIWMESLNSNKNFNFYPGYRLINCDRKAFQFNKDNRNITVTSEFAVLCMGGASYPSTGSDGKWSKLLKNIGIKTIPFKAINCGFECQWSPFFKKGIDHTPMKNIKLKWKGREIRGDLTITAYGIEGGPIYHFSREIRNSLEQHNKENIILDILPDLTEEEIFIRLSNNRGKDSLSNHLRKSLKLTRVVILLLREFLQKEYLYNNNILAKKIKNLPISLDRPRPIEEAISSSGGISFTELDGHFMLKKFPGWFTAGEMIDWDAPTGGYLLQGCFSTAYMAVEGISKYKN